ncbi:MAG TPA: hypothetical protein VMT76_17590 [Puia sp.]|nr:hypothetical protein [Puia sp.]
MKHLNAFFSLVIILMIASVSAMLYLNKQYVLSAILTVIWVVAITRWIAQRKLGIQFFHYLKIDRSVIFQEMMKLCNLFILKFKDFFLKDIVE